MALSVGQIFQSWVYFSLMLKSWRFVNGQILYHISEEAAPSTPVRNLATDLNLKVQDLGNRGFHIVTKAYSRYFISKSENRCS